MKWLKEDIDMFYKHNKNILIKNNKLISLGSIKNLGKVYMSWYSAIAGGKKGYKNAKDFKEIYLLKLDRNSTKNIHKWTKESIDVFFISNRKKLINNNDLITHKEILRLGREYSNWYQAIVRKYCKAYKTVEHFRKEHGLIKFYNKKWDKGSVDLFYTQHKGKLIKFNKLISPKFILELGKEYDYWYQAINRGNCGYKNMNFFKEVNNLEIPNKVYKWDKKEIDGFYKENKIILTNGLYLLPGSKISILGNKYRSWYTKICTKNNGTYKNLDDFKKKEGLVLGRTKSIK